SRLAGVLLILALLALWQYSAVYVVKKPTWPPVSLVWESWLERLLDGTLLGHLWATFWRQMTGYTIACVLGVALGLLMGYSRFFYNLLEPLVGVLGALPGAA